MKKITLLLILLTTLIFARVNVVTSYPYLGEIVKEVGGNQVHVKVLASPKVDPHFVTPRPSLIPAIVRADILVANGAGLEIGWLPPLIRSANNPKVRIGSKGFIDASQAIRLIDVPKAVSRAYGDIHPEGNPHFNTDPHNILPIARLVAKKLEETDPTHRAEYEKNLQHFTNHWERFLKEFDKKMQKCKDKKVVQYHELYNYLLRRYGMKSLIDIEPLPGIAPSSKHTLKVINTIKQHHIDTILQDPYHEKRTAKFIAAKTGAKVVILPHDVGSVKGADRLESF